MCCIGTGTPGTATIWRLRLELVCRPIILDLEKYFSAPFVVIELRFEECSQLCDAFYLCILDIVHPPVNVFVGLFVLDLLSTQFFFNAKVLFLRFLHL
jgi:hypothetical protein